MFQSLNKLKRTSIMTSIILMFAGFCMILCPADYIPTLIDTLGVVLRACVLFFGSCVLCMTDIRPRTANGILLIAAAGFIFSVALAIFAVRRMKKK